jgi:branched-chain amino acid transport system substrate-binding protein
VQQFVLKFRRRFGAEPDAGAALGYDAIRLLADAIARGRSSESAVVARALHATHEWAGVTGPVTFDSTGSAIAKPILKLVVRGGHFEYLLDSALARIDAPSRARTHQAPALAASETHGHASR